MVGGSTTTMGHFSLRSAQHGKQQLQMAGRTIFMILHCLVAQYLRQLRLCQQLLQRLRQQCPQHLGQLSCQQSRLHLHQQRPAKTLTLSLITKAKPEIVLGRSPTCVVRLSRTYVQCHVANVNVSWIRGFVTRVKIAALEVVLLASALV